MTKPDPTLRGAALLNDPLSNRGTAFTTEERSELGLEGLLPAATDTLETQIQRVKGHLSAKEADIERYIYLMGLYDRNETLFYATIMSDPAGFMPIIYAPTVGEACRAYGSIYRRPRGMYLTKHMRGRFREVLGNWPTRDIRFICITSGGRILGFGDIGINGAPIPVGKLQLYTACAGVPPSCLLPIHLDLGTTNPALRADPLYLGLRESVPESGEIDEIVDEFVAAVGDIFPNCCIHFEDWNGEDAIRLLDRYCHDVLCFNDDIQGTASVAISGMITASQILNRTLADHTYLFAGAGSAGIGIADMLVRAMVDQGLDEAAARRRIVFFDVHGLLESTREDLNDAQRPYAHELEPTDDLVHAVEQIKPTVLIGVSTVGGLFTERVVKTMREYAERPILFPMSNPTEKAECTAEDAYRWTDGTCLYAAGVQFPEVEFQGHTFYPGQANNFYVFPAVALAIYATKPKSVDDRVFLAAAYGNADQVRPQQREAGMLFPDQRSILQTEVTTATRVAEHLFDRELATVPRPRDIRAWLEGMIYQPRYD